MLDSALKQSGAPGALSVSGAPLVNFGQFLIDKGFLTEEQWKLASMQHEATGESISRVLAMLGFISHRDLVQAMLEHGTEDFFEEERFSPNIPSAVMLGVQTMVVVETDTTLYLATLQPVELVRSVLQAHQVEKELVFVPCDALRLKRYLNRLEARQNKEQLLETLLQRAAKRSVSDIHIIPKETSFLVMFRYLGVRYPEYEGPYKEYVYLVSRIKDLSGMDLAERRLPQDGAFPFEYESRKIDIRTSSVPVQDGEIITLRLLDPLNAAPSLEQIGITRLAEWKKGISRSSGLCLICGPTGSGKTTTLNATIKGLDRFGSAVYSVEDPVEYRVPLMGQVSVNQAIGLDFGRALKAFMRADPDIIILGEIRDAETAKNVVRAAETGHLVMATLHTESIFGAVQRLRDLEVPERELVYLLRSVLVQRLVRKVCVHCQGKGCARCHQYGYVGRTVISECAYFKDEAAVTSMLKGIRDWPTLLEDAISKMQQGITTPEEIVRVFGTEALELIKERPASTQTIPALVESLGGDQ